MTEPPEWEDQEAPEDEAFPVWPEPLETDAIALKAEAIAFGSWIDDEEEPEDEEDFDAPEEEDDGTGG